MNGENVLQPEMQPVVRWGSLPHGALTLDEPGQRVVESAPPAGNFRRRTAVAGEPHPHEDDRGGPHLRPS